jgi:hypothetical protein
MRTRGASEVDEGSKAALIMGAAGLTLLAGIWLFRRLFGPPPPHDPTVGDGDHGHTPLE